MLPMTFPDKRAALLAAFASRFTVGLLAATVVLPIPAWTRGLIVGFLVSLPDAIVTRAYAPILIIGSIGFVTVKGTFTGGFRYLVPGFGQVGQVSHVAAAHPG